MHDIEVPTGERIIILACQRFLHSSLAVAGLCKQSQHRVRLFYLTWRYCRLASEMKNRIL